MILVGWASKPVREDLDGLERPSYFACYAVSSISTIVRPM